MRIAHQAIRMGPIGKPCKAIPLCLFYCNPCNNRPQPPLITLNDLNALTRVTSISEFPGVGAIRPWQSRKGGRGFSRAETRLGSPDFLDWGRCGSRQRRRTKCLSDSLNVRGIEPMAFSC